MDDSRKRKLNDTADSDDGDQAHMKKSGGKRKIIGPALPSEHASWEQKISHDDDSDDSDDDIGPVLPPAGTEHTRLDNKADDAGSECLEVSSKENHHMNSRQRDEWMLQPPEESDWTSRVDPTKLRNRKFQTGRSTRGPPVANRVDSSWTENPEQKMERIRDKEATRKDVAQQSGLKSSDNGDDPGMRPFDREKDMATSSSISNAQRRELLNKAADFGSRFTGGRLL
ncbi:hypothetical protein SI65_04877 [Aspergillus cristatus]|uniref:DUF3752 domain-containing protein n=1 Tax=Aspergillus cristatus TaxID=573508 RepID=A0A1E3BGH7_ASPCR|nr:hypothetical protein SI65_04877 [Aspergillus cristatus]